MPEQLQQEGVGPERVAELQAMAADGTLAAHCDRLVPLLALRLAEALRNRRD